jgi:hypothetical protein
MAKKRKSKGMDAVPSSGGGSGRLSTDIADAENGYVITVSGETPGKNPTYFSKRYISPTREGALSISSSHLSGSKKSKGKKSNGKKKISLKQS